MNNIDFFTPIYYERTGNDIKNYLFNGIEDYFSLYGQKAYVLPGIMVGKSQAVELQNPSKNLARMVILGTIKLITYATGIIPLIMLIAKSIFRATHQFHQPTSSTENVSESAENVSESTENASKFEAALNRFQALLGKFLESEDDDDHIEEHRKLFLDAFPQLRNIIAVIQSQISDRPISEFINALYVVAGMKPVLVVENKSLNDDQILFLRSIAEAFPHVKLVDCSSSFGYCLVNETPMMEFDPRRFLKELDATYSSLEAAVRYAFPNQNQKTNDQMLSYLLGFGPTWEVYAQIAWYRQESDQSSVFSDEHYFQLGEAVHKSSDYPANKSRQELIMIGKKWSSDNILSPRLFNTPAEAQTDQFYMHQCVDELSCQTRYIQNAIIYRKRFLKLLEIPERTRS